MLEHRLIEFGDGSMRLVFTTAVGALCLAQPCVAKQATTSPTELQAAFAVAFSGSTQFVDRSERLDPTTYNMRPKSLIKLGDILVLVTEGTTPDRSHVEQGVLAITYLHANASAYAVVG